MSVARKKVPYQYPRSERTATEQELIRQVKIEAENLRDKIQKSIIDNPRAAKKSALILSLWIQGKDKKKKK